MKKNAMEIVSVGRAILTSASRGIFLLFMTLMVAGYLMYTREDVIGFFRGLVPARSRLSFDRLLFRMERGLSGVVRGQLVICLVNGILSAIGFWLFDLKYWPVLALVAAVGSLIPIFGSILSTVPAVLIGLTQDFWTALWALLWVLGIHQLEANFLNPRDHRNGREDSPLYRGLRADRRRAFLWTLGSTARRSNLVTDTESLPALAFPRRSGRH
ncbi:MAG: AI-2E family transporter [Polyangiaceae bacterium]